MKYEFKNPPRTFSPGKSITIKDCGTMNLAVDEQITYTDENGFESDFTRKEWGYYIANGLNHKIKTQGYKTALFASKLHSPPSIYICLVDENKIKQFNDYLNLVQAKLIMWLDEIDTCEFFTE